MSSPSNTLFLRLEGPLQSWGDNSKFVIRRTMEAPTKSGVLGLICCAKGIRREDSRKELEQPNKLAMGVRIDRPGTRWWDYHTIGAKVGILKADGTGIKRTGGRKDGPIETLISRREYLCDASFLVALQGDPEVIAEAYDKLKDPTWPVFLGRKSCPPGLPVLARPRQGEDWSNPMDCDDLERALSSVPWYPRLARDWPRKNGVRQETITLNCLLEWRPSAHESLAPDDAEVWYDNPVVFGGFAPQGRLVQRKTVAVEIGGIAQHHTPAPPRPRAEYGNPEYKKRRSQRLQRDNGLCVFCKAPASTVQHVTYRRAGGNEAFQDLRSLCRLCHDAVTMI